MLKYILLSIGWIALFGIWWAIFFH
ncbi:Protein of unknown function [Bacillus mycoides]|nr:Protein of unknown function [Bacillus mycoides]